MYPSLGSAQFGSVLARGFKEKARLGSARYVFEKARFLKNAQNEPKIKTHVEINILALSTTIRLITLNIFRAVCTSSVEFHG